MHVILYSANHQATSITAISSPSAGNTVEAYAALSANITATFNNRNNADANGTDATTTQSSSASWNNSSTLSKTFTWGSATQLRYLVQRRRNDTFKLE